MTKRYCLAEADLPYFHKLIVRSIHKMLLGTRFSCFTKFFQHANPSFALNILAQLFRALKLLLELTSTKAAKFVENMYMGHPFLLYNATN